MQRSNFPKKLKKWVKHNFERYCSVSTMHGYTELYSSKTCLFKWSWIFIILGSIAVTCYQVKGAISDYINQSTNTNIAPAMEDQVIYPPIKICFPHWLLWLNFTKADEYFSKNAALYSLSFLSNIYSIEKFDIQEARKEFLSGFSKHNFTNIFDYYEQLALKPYALINVEPFDSTVTDARYEYRNIKYVSDIFTFDWFKPQSEFPSPCYMINGTKLKTHFETKKNFSIGRNSKHTLQLYLFPMINYWSHNNMPDDNITFSHRVWNPIEWTELLQYMNVWSKLTKPNDFLPKHCKIPYIIQVDGYSDEYCSVSSDQQIVTFKVKTSGYIWKSSAARPCHEGKFITSNKTCEESCSLKYYVESLSSESFDDYIDNCSLLLPSVYVKHDKDDFRKLCRNTMYFGRDWTVEEFDTDTYSTNKEERNNDVKVRQMIAETLTAQCRQNCTTSFCENWKFEISRSIQSDGALPVYETNYPQVVVEYPDMEQVLVLTEVDRQTWENFVGSVGGLLGIWTGASILSFLQLFYLCCCADVDETYTGKWLRLRKSNAVTVVETSIKPTDTHSMQLQELA